MEEAGFGPRFIHAVRTLYKGAESAVITNGKTTPAFPLERGCRQGDPIAPYLFLLAIEPLLTKLRANNNGVRLAGGIAKDSNYAVDITLISGSKRAV